MISAEKYKALVDVERKAREKRLEDAVNDVMQKLNNLLLANAKTEEPRPFPFSVQLRLEDSLGQENCTESKKRDILRLVQSELCGLGWSLTDHGNGCFWLEVAKPTSRSA